MNKTYKPEEIKTNITKNEKGIKVINVTLPETKDRKRNIQTITRTTKVIFKDKSEGIINIHGIEVEKPIRGDVKIDLS